MHIGDRESNIFELFCMALDLGTHFLARTCVDRLADDGDHTVAAEMKDALVEAIHEMQIRDDKDNRNTTTVIYAQERAASACP
ncbi:hypothetical protein PX860_12275 [Agrobacterium leguminum]|uniref:hypothetical protein n=1 Tax=Agrobacterium leguminum TaxID=2792015 RepID=UPI002729F54C|nr:hypothetical protein [Agrobacterium leguminum]WLD96323.1 hypothetical protein PX860_12275 [Agrobacterium leguminum]